jgi:hypothetical protein
MPLSRSAKNAGFSLILAFAAPALACEVPDDGASPLRPAITRVKHLAETEAWLKALPEARIAQFVLLVDSPRRSAAPATGRSKSGRAASYGRCSS